MLIPTVPVWRRRIFDVGRVLVLQEKEIQRRSIFCCE